jgi:hypothetical protein
MASQFAARLTEALAKNSDYVRFFKSIASTGKVAGTTGRPSIRVTISIRPARKDDLFCLNIEGADASQIIPISETVERLCDPEYWIKMMHDGIDAVDNDCAYIARRALKTAANEILAGMALSLDAELSDLKSE